MRLPSLNHLMPFALSLLVLQACGPALADGNGELQIRAATGSAADRVAYLVRDYLDTGEATNAALVRFADRSTSEASQIEGMKTGTPDLFISPLALKEPVDQVSSDLVGYESYAVVVHSENPVANLAAEDLAGIYSGRIRNWSAVGGKDKEIAVFSMDPNGGAYNCLRAKLFGGCELDSDIVRFIAPNAVRFAVKAQPNIIVIVAPHEVRLPMKAISLDGVEMSDGTVRSGRYPLSRPLYAYTKEEIDETGQLGRALSKLKTEAGGRALRALGLVPAGPE